MATYKRSTHTTVQFLYILLIDIWCSYMYEADIVSEVFFCCFLSKQNDSAPQLEHRSPLRTSHNIVDTLMPST